MIWDKILDYCREKQIWAEKTMEVTDWNMLFGSGIKEQEDYIRKRDNIAGIKLCELPPLTEVDGFLVNIANATSLPKLTRSFQPRIVPKLYC